MKTVTLIGIAASSPLIQQVARKEVAMFRIAINKKDFVGERVVLCDTPPLVSRARLSVTKGTHIAIEGQISDGQIFVSTMLIMT